MGVGAQADHVLALVQHVGSLLGAPRGHLTHRELQLKRLGLAGLQQVGLSKGAQDNRGLLGLTLGVRGGVVDLDNVLAGHVAGVGDGHGGGHLVVSHARDVQRLAKGGVGQAIAKREDDGLVVVKAGVVAVGRLDRCGLVVAVAHVDALFVLDKVGGAVRGGASGVASVIVRDVGVVLATKVAKGGVGGKVGGPNVGRAARGVDLAGQELAHGGGAGGTQGAHAQNSVGRVLAAHQGAHLKRGRGVDQDNHLAAVGLGSRKHALLLNGKLKLVLALDVVGRLVVSGELLRDARVQVAEKIARKVAALAAAAANDHNGRGARDGGLRVSRIGAPGDLADVVARGGGVVHRDLGLGVVAVGAGDELVGGLVDVEARGGNAIVQVHAGAGVNGARAGAAVDGVCGVAAQEADLGARGQRQRAVVLEKDGALAQDLGHDLIGLFGGLGAAAVLGVVVVGVPVLGAGHVLDGRRTAAQVVVKKRAEHVGAHVGSNGDAQKAGRDGGVGYELTTSDGLLRLLLSHVLILSRDLLIKKPVRRRRRWAADRSLDLSPLARVLFPRSHDARLRSRFPTQTKLCFAQRMA